MKLILSIVGIFILLSGNWVIVPLGTICRFLLVTLLIVVNLLHIAKRFTHSQISLIDLSKKAFSLIKSKLKGEKKSEPEAVIHVQESIPSIPISQDQERVSQPIETSEISVRRRYKPSTQERPVISSTENEVSQPTSEIPLTQHHRYRPDRRYTYEAE